MFYIFMGIFAFILFVLYDINSVIMKNKLLNCSFFAGFLLLIGSTVGIIVTSREKLQWNTLRIGCYGFLAILFLILLIYTLFFALPFENTYIRTESQPTVCQNGVYALCRHPGVLWFIGFYIFMGLALDLPLFLIAAVIFNILNIIYVIIQDRWTFLKMFADYDKYKLNTPFLLPNLKSIKRCFETL